MATSTQTDELGRNLSDNDLAALMSEIYPISLSHVLAFGVQLQISGSKIEELRIRLHTHNDKGDVLLEILQEALRREPPLTRREIIQALQDCSVGESSLASQIVSQYQPPSQRDRETLQLSCLQQPPSASLCPTLGNAPQIFSNIQPPPQPNTSHLLFLQQLTTELPRTNQPQSNLDQVGQSHQLPAGISMPPQPAPQTSQSVSLQPQPGPSATSLQWTHQIPAVPQLTLSAQPQTNIPPPSINTQPSPWLENSQLVASQPLIATQLPRLNQPQPNLDQVGQSHQLPASQRMSMPRQPGPQMQLLSQLQFVPHHPNLPLLIHPGYPFPLLPYPPIQGSQDQNIPQPSHHTPYQQDQGHQSHQFQWQSSSQPPSQHHHSPVFPSQHFHTSDTNLPQTQESQSSPAPIFAAISESTPFLEPSPSPRQQPSPLPRQQPSPSPRQQPSPSPRQQPSPSPRQQPSPLPRQPSPSPRQQPSPLPRQQPSPSPRQQPSPLPRQQPSPSRRQQPSLLPRQPSPSPRQQPSPLPRQQPSPSRRQQPSLLPRQPSPSPRQQSIPVSSAGSPAPPPTKRLRQQSPSPPYHSPPAGGATTSTAVYPPHVHDFISFVKKTYSAQKVLKDEKWSLSPTVKFINLACIDRKCVKSREYNDERVKRVKSTEFELEFSEIAKGISLPSSDSEQENDRRLILVEGAPGVGKSTFAWEFCRKWMNGEIAQQYHLVLLLRLRDKRIREAKNLKDLFFNSSRPDESLAVYNELKNSHTFHALIILEGYDELPDYSRNDSSSIFNELISGDSLPLATVLVTSRPWATKDLHVKHTCHIYQHIEVLGFTKKQIKEYINKNVGEEKIRSGLYSYLEKYPQIRSGMYIPLNSAIVVAVYKESIENDRQTLPNTITELYSCCIEILIRRHLNHNTGLQGGNEINLPTINLRVPSDVHRNFVHMCHLAFSGIVEATEVKLIFSESELPEHFDNLGFMDSVTDLYVTGETVSSHNFLHLTFQEFFAAVHISTMSKEQQLQYFMEGKSDSGSKGGRLNVVLKFLAGLQKLDCFTNETASCIVNTPSSVSSCLTPCDITVGMDVVNWLFEAQSETAMSLILGERKVKFKASKRHIMSPMDYYCLGYCISHSQCQWVLELESKMELTKERIKLLADGAREVTGEGKVVELCHEVLSHLNEDKLILLFTEWNKFLCLQELSLTYRRISDDGAIALAKALDQNSIFQSLNLDNNSISSVGATAMAQSLYYNSTLKQLSLSGNIIGNSGAVALAESLHQNTTLQILSLSGNHISCDILTTSLQSLSRLPVPEHITITSILRVTNKGIRFEDTFNDFILDIPDGAIPEEEGTLTLYMGVTLFGPYQFPEGLRPISPVFWVCVKEQNNFQFSKPVTVTIPHCLDLDNYDNVQSLGITFLKAGHIPNTEKMYEFQCTNSGKDLSKTHGYFTTSHFCSLCMAANDIPQTRSKTPFCLTVAIPKFTIPVGKSVYAYFFITFMRLETCLRAVDILIEKMNLKSFMIQKEQFKFQTKDKNPALKIVCTDSEHGKIRVKGKTEVCI